MQKTTVRTYPHPISDTSYRVTVTEPAAPPPAGGYPVLYVLDGNAYGAMFWEILKLQWRRPGKTGIPPLVIVSIGYDTGNVFEPLRVFDFTPPAREVSLPERQDGIPWPWHGGADRFLDFLENTVAPFVRKAGPVNPKHSILFGYSLGGLFTLYALFRRPEAFRHWISFSPSIWWNEKQLLEHVPQDGLQAGRTLFIATEVSGRQGMHENARALFERLRQVNPGAVAFSASAGENHMSIVPATISEALRYMFEGTGI